MRKRDPETRFFEKVAPMPDDRGCWEWYGSLSGGYGSFGVGAGNVQPAHRYSYILAFGRIPEGPGAYRTFHVCHKCDNKTCVNPAHLFLGTASDNLRDAFAKGRGPRRKGIHNGSAIITPEIAADIRERYARGGISQAALGREYGVTAHAVCAVVNNRSWKV